MFPQHYLETVPKIWPIMLIWWFRFQGRLSFVISMPLLQTIWSMVRCPWLCISKLNLCEGGSFSPTIFTSDIDSIELSVSTFRVLYLFVEGNICRKLALFFLVDIKKRSFLTSCVFWFAFLNASSHLCFNFFEETEPWLKRRYKQLLWTLKYFTTINTCVLNTNVNREKRLQPVLLSKRNYFQLPQI